MKRKAVLAITVLTLAFAMTACSQLASDVAEETDIIERVSTENEEPSAIDEDTEEILEESTDGEEESAEVAESELSNEENLDASVVAEDVVNTSHTYEWGINYFEGEYGMVISIVTNGVPSASDSTIDFTVTESIYDYKLFTDIKCGDSLVLNKESNPEWMDSVYGGDGIFGFVGDGFSLSLNENDDDENGEFRTTFAYNGNGGGRREYTVIWHIDGSVTVDTGDLMEQ